MNAVMGVVLAELFRMSRRKRLLLLASVYWVVVPLILLLVTPTLRSALTDVFSGSRVLLQTLASPFGLAATGTGLGGYASPSLYFVIVAVIATAMIGDDYRFSTWKSTFVLQPRRGAVLAGKLIAGHLVVLSVLLGNLLGSVVLGGLGTLWLGTTFAGNWSVLITKLLLQWLFLFAPLTFSYLVVFYIRSTGLAVIIILFLMPVAELIYQILSSIVRFNPASQLAHFFKHQLVQPWWNKLPDWFFTTNTFSPSREAFNPILGMLGGGTQITGRVGALHSATVLLVYSVVFLLVLIPAFRRRDVA